MNLLMKGIYKSVAKSGACDGIQCLKVRGVADQYLLSNLILILN